MIENTSESSITPCLMLFQLLPPSVGLPGQVPCACINRFRGLPGPWPATRPRESPAAGRADLFPGHAGVRLSETLPEEFRQTASSDPRAPARKTESTAHAALPRSLQLLPASWLIHRPPPVVDSPGCHINRRGVGGVHHDAVQNHASEESSLTSRRQFAPSFSDSYSQPLVVPK